MGQHWILLNLEKHEFYSLGKLGESFCDRATGGLASVVDEWASDRRMCIGNAIRDYPEGVFSQEELEKAVQLESLDFSLYQYYQQKYKDKGSPETCLPKGPDWILRNLSKLQYVRAHTLPAIPFKHMRTPDLGAVLLSRICWSTRLSVGYYPTWPGTRKIYQGIWAGDRFDLVLKNNFERNEGEGMDVSEEVSKEIYAIWASDYSAGDKRENESETITRPTQYSSEPICKPFPSIPFELTSQIMEFLMEEDKSTCLHVGTLSKAMQPWVTPKVYSSVILDLRCLKLFQRTLDSERGSDLGRLVRRLFVSTETVQYDNAKAEDCKHLSKVLESCPKLERLFTNCCIPDMAIEKTKTPAPWFVAFQVTSTVTWLQSPHLPITTHALLRNVSHLCINSSDLATLACLKPAKIPRLTYLGVNCISEDEFDYAGNICEILQAFDSLKMVLLLSYSVGIRTEKFLGDKWGNVAKIADKRLIARPGLTEAEYEAIMSDKGTFWDDAEMIYSGWREKCIAS